MKNILRFPLFSLAGLVLTGANANAAIVFSQNFEAPDLDASATPTYAITGTSATSRTTPSGWVRSNTGFGSGAHGLISGSYEGFTAPGGDQAYGFRYTNSGLTSAFGVIGSLTAGTVITVNFDVFDDGTNNGSTPMTAALVTYNGAGSRNDTSSGLINGTSSYLKTISGSAPASGFSTWIIQYTVGDAVIDSNGAAAGGSTTFNPAVLGHDIAIRFQGATNSASIDNVTVSIVIPEPSTALAGLLLGVGLLRRRRY